MVFQYSALTLNTDVNDCGEASSDSICCLTEIITLTGFLDIFQHQSPVNNLDIGLDLCIELPLVLWLVSCNKDKPHLVEAIKLKFMGFLGNSPAAFFQEIWGLGKPSALQSTFASLPWANCLSVGSTVQRGGTGKIRN